MTLTLSLLACDQVCTVQEAKTVYPLVGIAANCALVVAGNFMKLVNRTVIQVCSYALCAGHTGTHFKIA